MRDAHNNNFEHEYSPHKKLFICQSKQIVFILL